MKLSEIYPENGKVQRIYCEQCGCHTVLSYTTFNDLIEDVRIIIEGLPVLLCKKCRCHYLPDKSRFAIIYTFEQAVKHKKQIAKVIRKKPNEIFGFTNIPFIYDSDDYYYIPGLTREHDPGFLTPVFFNVDVLLKFDNSPEYRISFASKTYGDIRKGDDYSISFGINEYRKVIMWLGDIATLPENEQYYLRSENVVSNHAIGCEFYDGQIECIFTDLSPEDELIKARSQFHESAYKKFGQRITHLDKETLTLIEDFTPPVVETEKEIRHMVDLLNKINIESLDSAVVGKLLQDRGIDDGKLGGLKRLQKLFEHEYLNEDIATIVSPLFVLYDLRVAYLHLTPTDKRQEMISFSCKRLGLTTTLPKFADIYSRMLTALTQSYERLAEMQN